MSRFAKSAVAAALAIALAASPEALQEECSVDEDFSLLQTQGNWKYCLSLGPRRKVHFIRIQKTASSTFTERLIPHFCRYDSTTCPHDDYELALRGDPDVDLITMLRDPVERTLSEFFFMRTAMGRCYCKQEQWDFLNTTWRDNVMNTEDTDTALEIYLRGYPGNPSQNRQTQYLVGFKGGERADPFDWENNRTALLSLAKQHLRQTKAFGIVECMDASVRLLARALRWNEAAAVKMAGRTHEKPLDRESHAQLLRAPPAALLETNASITRRRDRGPGGAPWRSLVRPEIVAEIEKWSSVDMELYQFAWQLFRERAGGDC